MKRLLLPLLAALSFPTAVVAGDLGTADLEPKGRRSVIADVDTFSEKGMFPTGNKDLYSVKCGIDFEVKKSNLKSQGLLSNDEAKLLGEDSQDLKKIGINKKDYRPKKCTVIFEGNKMRVNDSKGITANQIINFWFTDLYINGHRVNIIYKDSQGFIKRAVIDITYRFIDPIFEQFSKRFIRLLNEGGYGT